MGRECCEDSNVPKICLGLCSPPDVMARNENRLTACTKYDVIIEKCWQGADDARAASMAPPPAPSYPVCGHCPTQCPTWPFCYIDGTATTKSESIQTTIDAEQRVAKGCCAKIKVESNGIARQHLSALGTFQRSNSLEKSSSGSKIIYTQDKSPHNIDQYYLEGNEKDGWRIGRKFNGKIEGLLMYNGIKMNCPANQWKSDWLVSTSSGYVPDSKLVIKCIDAHPDQEVNKTCRYERLWTTNGVMEDKEKGSLVDIHYNMKSYNECESKCSLTKGCMNFEFCKKLRSCRLYDGKITSPKNLKKKMWYNCSASYRTCKNA